MELVAMATDLAEFLGAANWFQFALWDSTLAGWFIDRYRYLSYPHPGTLRLPALEAVITALVGVVAVSYLIETILDRPNWSTVVYHTFVPQFSGTESVLLATGILGATVMPT